MRQNLASWDRIVRFVLFVTLVPVGIWVVGGALGIVLAAVGLIMGATGSVGYCPLEQISGMESKPANTVRRGRA
ncbi:MAG: DUF2892 domain-containing protein [Dehalococcoidia bacterium]